jgi:uncharacterized hydrophobic protein (TIGR00341 family)
MRLIEANYPSKLGDKVSDAIKEAEPDYYRIVAGDDDRCVARIYFDEKDTQDLIDKLQDICEGAEDWRLFILPIEGTAPKIEIDKSDKEAREQKRQSALREEIYSDVADGAKLNSNFIALTVASAVVAAIGLNADNVAAVIGAMVIAPLLGPIIAFSFGSTLGDLELMSRSGRNALIGLGIGLVGAALIGALQNANLESRELMSRVVVGLDSIALGLAAGAAAALSVATGASSALVGVMVAVALLPPAAAIGLFLGAGEFSFAARAALLLTVNIVCIMIATQAVFFWKKVQPRTWLEKKKAAKAQRIKLIVLVVLLAAAAAIILFAPTEALPDLG